MRTSKNYRTNADLIHAYAHASKDESGQTYSGALFFKDDVIYSYGHHFPMARKFRDNNGEIDFILINSYSYSNSTTKHQADLRMATRQYKQIYSDFYDGLDATYKGYFEEFLINLIDHEITVIKNAKTSLARARSKWTINGHASTALNAIDKVRFLVNYFRIKTKLRAKQNKVIFNEAFIDEVNNEHRAALERYEARNTPEEIAKREAAAEKRREAKRLKEIEENKQHIQNWRNGKGHSLRIGRTDFLRVITRSVYGYETSQTFVETSQGVKISINEAKRLVKLIDLKQAIGEKVNDKYTITACNGILKAGCHNIPKEEIDSVRNILKI